MWNTLLGGLLVILGGFTATWLQVRYSRKTKMNEVIAEKTVSANAEAYSFMKEILSLLQNSGADIALKHMLAKESWFFSNRLFLPGKFPNKWLTVRNNLSSLRTLEQSPKETTSDVAKLKSRITHTGEQAIYEIYREMNLKPIEVEDLGEDT